MERGRIQGLPKFFLSQKRVKLRTSTFVRTFLVSTWNKSPLQISGKVAGCIVRTFKTFQGTRILAASRGLLCDSSAVLFISGLLTTLFCFEYTFWLDLRLEITITAALPRDGNERESSVASHDVEVQFSGAWSVAHVWRQFLTYRKWYCSAVLVSMEAASQEMYTKVAT